MTPKMATESLHTAPLPCRATSELLKTHGIAPEEYERILQALGREPSLTELGIYSVMAFSAALRVQEMAIRLALGSPRSGILGLIFGSATKLAIAGCVIGLVGATAASRLLESFLFGVSPLDPVVLTLAAACVLVLALAASFLPARRAATIDPMQALRAD